MEAVSSARGFGHLLYTHSDLLPLLLRGTQYREGLFPSWDSLVEGEYESKYVVHLSVTVSFYSHTLLQAPKLRICGGLP